MRNIKLTFGMFAFATFLTFSACQKDDAVTPDPASTEYAASEYQLADLNKMNNPEVTTATEGSEFKVRDSENNTASHSLGFILRQLKLSEGQSKAVKGFVVNHAACIAAHREKVQELNKELVKRANAVREEHVRAYRAGKITKAELEEKLAALRERLKDHLNKDEIKQMHMRALHKCRADLMTGIESVLDAEQLQKWNHWKQSQK